MIILLAKKKKYNIHFMWMQSDPLFMCHTI